MPQQTQDPDLQTVQDIIHTLQDIDIPADVRELIAFAMYPIAKAHGWWQGPGTFLHDIGFENGEIAEMLTKRHMKDKYWFTKFGNKE